MKRGRQATVITAMSAVTFRTHFAIHDEHINFYCLHILHNDATHRYITQCRCMRCTRCTYSTRTPTSRLLHNNITDRSNWIISIPLLMYILFKWMQTHEFLLQYRLKSIAITVCAYVWMTRWTTDVNKYANLGIEPNTMYVSRGNYSLKN